MPIYIFGAVLGPTISPIGYHDSQRTTNESGYLAIILSNVLRPKIRKRFKFPLFLFSSNTHT